jgi:transcriptional regulator with XRE-family HTH domain
MTKKRGDIMVTLYERLDSLCKEKGIKGGRMCTDLGISKSLMTDLKMGRKTGVSAVTAQKIAAYFNVSVGYLLGEEDEKKEQPTEFDGLSDKRKALIDFAMSVPDDKAEMILRVMKSIVEGDE